MTEAQAVELLASAEAIGVALAVVERGVAVLVFTVALCAALLSGGVIHRWVRGQ